MGHYNLKRGFTEPVREIITKLVGLTRILWKSVRKGELGKGSSVCLTSVNFLT